MEQGWFESLLNSTLMSHELTHNRLKHFANSIGTSEDHVSRLALGLSLRNGRVRTDWGPSPLIPDAPLRVPDGKTIRGRTLFKTDLALFTALLVQHQIAETYDEFRRIWIAHWERGVQELTLRLLGSDWLEGIAALPVEPVSIQHASESLH